MKAVGLRKMMTTRLFENVADGGSLGEADRR